MERQHGECLVPFEWKNGRTTVTGQIKPDSECDNGGKVLHPFNSCYHNYSIRYKWNEYQYEVQWSA